MNCKSLKVEKYCSNCEYDAICTIVYYSEWLSNFDNKGKKDIILSIVRENKEDLLKHYGFSFIHFKYCIEYYYPEYKEFMEKVLLLH